MSGEADEGAEQISEEMIQWLWKIFALLIVAAYIWYYIIGSSQNPDYIRANIADSFVARAEYCVEKYPGFGVAEMKTCFANNKELKYAVKIDRISLDGLGLFNNQQTKCQENYFCTSKEFYADTFGKSGKHTVEVMFLKNV